ncbi:hypothetical protein V9T40_009512 [Parthenolecanium corni]|uniref:Uncharacterized protein n=1 Tax=Parthenolecanium corni TaxID=536013 RepID=A0AAN9TSH0_9HEMI
MGPAKVANSLNKTLHLTGIGLAVQAFYINLTLDSAMGGDFLQLAPAGPPIINPASVWDINGLPLAYGYNRGGLNSGAQRVGTLGTIGGQNYDANAYRDQNGYYLGNAGLKNGYDVGKTYGGGRDYGVTGVQGNAYGDVNGRNKGHQVAGFSTNYQKNESGNKATYYDDGLGHGGVAQYGLRDQRYRDGAGNSYGGGVHDSSLKTNNQGNQGQYGGAGGYRGTDNRGGTASNLDLYRGGLVQGAGASGGIVGPVASQPILIQQTLPVVQRALPIAPAAPIPLRGSPYAVPSPNRLYVDRPGFQNVLVAAV